jgi:hypothetical protein
MIALDDTILELDPTGPVNWQHPLNRGRLAWWMVPPNSGWRGSLRLLDLCGLSGRKADHGTLTNGPLWRGTTRPGGFGHLLFDATDDYVDLPASPAFNFGTGDFSIGVWLRPSDVSQFRIMLGKDVSGNRDWNLNHGITAAGGTSSGYLCFFDNVASTGPGSATVDSGGSVLTDNVWSRAVATRNGSTSTLYHNGVRVGQTTGVTTTFSATNAVQIGRREFGGFEQYFGGALDDVSVWSRGLSAAEAAADYNLSRRGYPGVLNRVAPVAYSIPAAGGGAYAWWMQQQGAMLGSGLAA